VQDLFDQPLLIQEFKDTPLVSDVIRVILHYCEQVTYAMCVMKQIKDRTTIFHPWSCVLQSMIFRHVDESHFTSWDIREAKQKKLRAHSVTCLIIWPLSKRVSRQDFVGAFVIDYINFLGSSVVSCRNKKEPTQKGQLETDALVLMSRGWNWRSYNGPQADQQAPSIQFHRQYCPTCQV
jgi:hypothetical protein